MLSLDEIQRNLLQSAALGASGTEVLSWFFFSCGGTAASALTALRLKSTLGIITHARADLSLKSALEIISKISEI